MAKYTRHHLSIDLKGALMHWKDKEWIGVVTEDGKKLSPREVKGRFLDLLASGVKLIPMDSSCDNFDPERGCRGHEYEKEDGE